MWQPFIPPIRTYYFSGNILSIENNSRDKTLACTEFLFNKNGEIKKRQHESAKKIKHVP